MIGYELFAQFLWPKFAAITAVYSFAVFMSTSSTPGVVLSNIRRSKIVVTHLIFVVVVLAVTWFAASTYSHLPPWMTSQTLVHRSGQKFSPFGVITFGILLLTYLVELTCFRLQSAVKEEAPQ